MNRWPKYRLLQGRTIFLWLLSLLALLATLALPGLVNHSWAVSPALPTQLVQLNESGTRLLLPDWQQISLSQLPSISSSGSLPELGRRWQAGQRPDEFLSLGDLSPAFQTEMFTLGQIADLTGLDLEQVALSEFKLVANQTVEQLVQAVPLLGEHRVKEVPPISRLFQDGYQEKTIRDVLRSRPQLAKKKLGQVDLSADPLTAIPNLENTQLNQFIDWDTSLVQDTPGLGEVPLAQMPTPLAPLGDVVARIDMIYGPAEAGANTISGSDVEGFAVSCDQTCAYIELDDLENQGARVKGDFEGKRWVSGKYQKVQGGHGALAALNNGLEPTGRHPFGPGFKIVVWDTNETTDTISTALFFRFCTLAGCSPYFIGPVPFLSYQANAPIFVGVLDPSSAGGTSVTQVSEQTLSSQPNNLGSVNLFGIPVPCDVFGNPIAFGGSGINLQFLSQAIATIESRGSGGYTAVGPYVCADGGRNCGRGLGAYQYMSYNPYSAQLIAAKPKGKAFLERVNQGYKPSQEELMQYFPQADQDLAFQRDLERKIVDTSRQIDPATNKPFVGDRLIERVAQKHFGGDASKVDGNGSDALGRLSLKSYGQQVLQAYKGQGSLACTPQGDSQVAKQ